jgi:hypothetical protein
MISFPGQRDGEKVIAVIRKNAIIYIKILLAFVVVVILPLALLLFFWFKSYPLSEFHVGGIIVELIACMLFLYSLLFLCIKWINEEFDVFIITSDRLIDVTQITFFTRSVTSTPLEHIQDTTGIISGFLPTIFQYGDVTAQTAGSQAEDIFIDHIHDPEGVARMILDYAHQKRSGTPLVQSY